jgi:hypothetical protein
MLAGCKTLSTQKSSLAVHVTEEEEKKTWMTIKETTRQMHS